VTPHPSPTPPPSRLAHSPLPDVPPTPLPPRDPQVAPAGKHIIHVYTAGSEPFDLWEGKDKKSQEYQDYKRERAKILWETIERIIPDIRQRVEVEIYASPLTHQKFLRRHRGTYGAAHQNLLKIPLTHFTPVKPSCLKLNSIS